MSSTTQTTIADRTLRHYFKTGNDWISVIAIAKQFDVAPRHVQQRLELRPEWFWQNGGHTQMFRATEKGLKRAAAL